MRSPAAFAEAAAALKRRRAELAAAQPQQRPASSSSQSMLQPPAVSKDPPSAHAPPTPHLAQAVQPGSAAAPEAVPAAQSGACSKAGHHEANTSQQAAVVEEMPTAAAVSGASSGATDSAAALQLPQPGVRTRSSARANAEATAAEVPCSAEAGALRGVNADNPLPAPATDQSAGKASTSQCSIFHPCSWVPRLACCLVPSKTSHKTPIRVIASVRQSCLRFIMRWGQPLCTASTGSRASMDCCVGRPARQQW